MATPATPPLLRALNDRNALGALLDHGVLTRAGIGDTCGLSKQTSSQVVQRLEAAGLIEPSARVSGGRGPDAIGYSVIPDRVLGVAVDAREDGLTSVVVDARGDERPLAETPRGRSALVDVDLAVTAACESAGVERAKIASVVIGVPGSVDQAGDTLRFAEDYPGWPDAGVATKLRDALGCAVVLDNDVKYAAVAERIDGVGRDEEGFALLWMGAGLGLAVDLAGSVIRGASGAAGEIGYIPVSSQLLSAGDGAAVLQDVIGGPAIARMVREAGAPGKTDAELFAALSAQPEAMDTLATRITLAVVPVLAVLDPGLLVLGGPVGLGGGTRLATLVAARIASITRWQPRVLATGVAGHPVLLGARAILRQELRTRLLDEVGRVD